MCMQLILVELALVKNNEVWALVRALGSVFGFDEGGLILSAPFFQLFSVAMSLPKAKQAMGTQEALIYVSMRRKRAYWH